MTRRAQGSNLDRGVTRASDYTVLLGDEQCIPSGQLSANMFHCRAPDSGPTAAIVDNLHCNDSLALIVSYLTLSFFYLRHGGYVFARVCLFVCLCVSKITQKVTNGSFLKFSGNVGNGKNYQ